MPEANGFSLPDIPQGKPYLGNLQVVTEFVNRFAHEVLRIEGAFRGGTPGYEDAQERIETVAKDYGRAIMGDSEEYAAAEWQNPKQLGLWINLSVPGVHYGDDYGAKLFEFLATNLINYNRRMERGEARESVGQQIRGHLDEVIAMIMGLKGVPK